LGTHQHRLSPSRYGGHSTRYVLDGASHGDLAFLGDPKAGLPCSTKQTTGIIIDFLKRKISGRTPPLDADCHVPHCRAAARVADPR
jgi:hypothetical protein